MTWQADKRWSDRFLPEIKAIIGYHLIVEPPTTEDAEHNTDLIVLGFDSVRVACRIRKNEYMRRYGDEFTIRAGRPSGMKTELTKIVEGWGDYIFYGFCDENEERLASWFIGDLKRFRLHYMRQLARGNTGWKSKENHDNSSSFVAFKRDCIDGFVIASSSDTQLRLAM